MVMDTLLRGIGLFLAMLVGMLLFSVAIHVF